ncbi:MAG TPA: fused MFS/spermidine synthase [Pyrinomonadaceae bacterium]|nr:fused MFS/spermidine synthase [Pyrinomonadaceae bacterium]
MKIFRAHTLLFGVTIFVSSALLFSIQPMIAKMLLPLLGGTPAVWNTCMLFFQAVLLCGYAYALLVSRWPLKRQLLVQLAILCLAFISLPIGLSSSWVNSVPPSDNPSLWVLACLAASVGLPFFIVSSNSPLLQKWFSRTATESAQDPYFLYSASNAGSLLALLAYPALMEPFFTLHAQGRLWTIVYGVLVLLIGMHAVTLWRSRTAEPVVVQEETHEARPSLNRRLRWLLLAFAPSSLMLGVTNYITTDIASVPLLWIIPLALYLLTMVFAFARKPLFSPRLAHLVVPGATVVLLMLYLADSSGKGSRVLVLLHLAYFFFAALMCHGQLAADRPGARYLAEFYVWLSLGGVLGGIFNALAAPVLFNSVIEYPLAIVLACLLLPDQDAAKGETKQQRLDFALPVLIFAFTVGLGWAADKLAPIQMSGSVFVVAVPLFVSYPLRKRPLRFALSLGAVILAAGLMTGAGGRSTLHSERNFFGVLRVSADQNLNLHSFLHGSTVHGRQSTLPEKRCEPTSYYHREGPLARIFKQFENSHTGGNIGIIGLGAGGQVSYSRPGEHWTFYEINPAVVSIAKSPEYFRYLSDCASAPIDIVLGDARLKLHNAKDQSYDLLVMDAFSSDSIPMHLLTQQALDLYLSKLANNGMLVFHISNRNLDLTEVIADLAKSRNLSGVSMLDMEPAKPGGKDPAHWVVMARNSADYGALASDPLAKPLVSENADDVWTDDFSNILSVFKWRKTK